MHLWCLYVEDDKSSWIKVDPDNYLHYTDWPGRFYRVAHGQLIPVVFVKSYEDEWHKKLPSK